MLFLYYNLFESLESLTNICVFGSFSVSSSIFIKKSFVPFNETDIKGTNDYYNLPIDSLIQGYIYETSLFPVFYIRKS